MILGLAVQQILLGYRGLALHEGFAAAMILLFVAYIALLFARLGQ